MTIYIKAKRLTDGSEVFDVHMGDVVLHAYNEEAAGILAETIAKAISEFSAEVGNVTYANT